MELDDIPPIYSLYAYVSDAVMVLWPCDVKLFANPLDQIQGLYSFGPSEHPNNFFVKVGGQTEFDLTKQMNQALAIG